MVNYGEQAALPQLPPNGRGAARSAQHRSTAGRSIWDRHAAARKCSLVAISMLVAGGACADPRCPKGYWQYGDTCYRMKDAGANDGVQLRSDAESAMATDALDDGDAQASERTDREPIDDASRPADAEEPSDAGSRNGSALDSGVCSDMDCPSDAGGSGDSALASDACSGLDCPGCDDARLCTGPHELCVGAQCVVQPYCGDGKKGADEECDPMHPAWTPWSCDTSCKLRTTYLACGGNLEEPEGGCANGERCANGQCIRWCNAPADCPAAPSGATVMTTCFVDALGMCIVSGCKAATDCPPSLACVYNSSPLLQMNICAGCDSTTDCPPGQTCKLASSVDRFRRCM